MELDTAARRMLLLQAGVTGYVGQKVFKNEMLEHVQGTSGRAVVVRKGGGWAAPDEVKSSEFPLLIVECWADADRDDAGQKLRDNAIDKAYALYRVVDPLMHRIRDVVWGAGGMDEGVRIITSKRYTEPVHSKQSYQKAGSNVPLHDSAVVTATYSIQL